MKTCLPTNVFKPSARSAGMGSLKPSPSTSTLSPVPLIVTSKKFMLGLPMKPATNMLSGWSYSILRRIDLLQEAVLHHGDAGAHGHGFGLVVGHVDEGGRQLLMQLGDLGAGLHAQFGVEVGERLVEQEDLRLAHDGAAHGHALALAARQLAGLARQQLLNAQNAGRFLHAVVDVLFFGLDAACTRRD